MNQPLLFDGATVRGFDFVPPGCFEAFGPNGRWRFGLLKHHAIPQWATRVHVNRQALADLLSKLKQDDEDEIESPRDFRRPPHPEANNRAAFEPAAASSERALPPPANLLEIAER